jgi:hypothetical protein
MAVRSETIQSGIMTIFFYLIAGGILYVGWRVVIGKTGREEGKIALLLFASAAGIVLAREAIWLLPQIQKLKFGEHFEISMREQVKELKTRTLAIQDEILDIREDQGRVGLSAKKSAAQSMESESNGDS